MNFRNLNASENTVTVDTSPKRNAYEK